MGKKAKPAAAAPVVNPLVFTDSVDNFRKFIRYCSLPGKGVMFTELLCKFDENGAVAFVSNSGKTAIGRILYFPKVEKEGVFVCHKLADLLGLLKAVDGDIKVTCGSGKIRIESESTFVEMSTCEPSDIKTAQYGSDKFDIMKFDGDKVVKIGVTDVAISMAVDASKLAKVVSNSKIVSSLVYYPFEVRNGKLFITANSLHNKIVEKIGEVTGFDASAYSDGAFVTEYHDMFANIISNLDGIVVISFDLEVPLFFVNRVTDEAETNPKTLFETFYCLMPFEELEDDENAEAEQTQAEAGGDAERQEQQQAEGENNGNERAGN
jgi:hypothetical protein